MYLTRKKSELMKKLGAEKKGNKRKTEKEMKRKLDKKEKKRSSVKKSLSLNSNCFSFLEKELLVNILPSASPRGQRSSENFGGFAITFKKITFNFKKALKKALAVRYQKVFSLA